MSLLVFSPNSWVIDSGATNHVSFDKSSFQSLHYIAPVLVSMPNGKQIMGKITKKIIGVAEQRKGLYAFENLTLVPAALQLASASFASTLST
ncbi:hypothetical protein PIB30_039606 [Stylosanthes scabra]|uniref:Retrovirus-related Pol polyprotein from transposon TNT 1-94-like beta-barrel domain-containing protein n=1 Tax=Stylosanthes scabra TaxID=79078 RepID=A0ABU6ZD26_9FABA|nr:hypothetical protein [Stylosanthes scabra]